jgi:hypothetical protein
MRARLRTPAEDEAARGASPERARQSLNRPSAADRSRNRNCWGRRHRGGGVGNAVSHRAMIADSPQVWRAFGASRTGRAVSFRGFRLAVGAFGQPYTTSPALKLSRGDRESRGTHGRNAGREPYRVSCVPSRPEGPWNHFPCAAFSSAVVAGLLGGIPLIYRLLTALCLAFVLVWTMFGPTLVGNRGALVTTVARLAR